jgi:hypothetical protein
MTGFIFGGNTPWSYEDLQKKRTIAEELVRANMSTPRNVGEGLNAIGRALAFRSLDKKASKRDAELKGEFDAQFNSAFGGYGGGGGFAGGGSSAPVWTPSAPTPMPKADTGMVGGGRGDLSYGLPPAAPEGSGAGLAFPAQGGGTAEDIFMAELAAGGLPEHVVHGIMMNAKDESNFDPNAVGDGGAALGLLQWNGPRKAALERFAASVGGSPTDPKIQAQFTLHELQGPERAAFDAVMSTKSAGEAGAAFVNHFERPAEEHRARREAAYLGGAAPTSYSGGGSGGGFSGGGGMDIATIAELAGNPYATPGQKAVLAALMKQQMDAMDPMRAIEMERAQLELAELKNPDAPKPLEVGGVLLDPLTYEPIYDSRQPDAGTNVTVNNGSGTGQYIYGTDAGVPAGWRVDTATGIASPIPGGPADVEQQQLADKKDKTATQGKLKLGTTLESINLNIAEIDNGGLPVTGAIGDARRTWLGRALTGDSAMDFGNRTNQITDQAALSEVQNMRDNSPTGGAVGSLTDSERVAIGNSVTAINNSTSAEEYARAAKAYRKLALDIAYGEGMWHIDQAGDVVARPGPSGAPAAPPAATANPAATNTPDADGWVIAPNGAKVRVKP